MLKIRIHNAETDEIIDREMTAEEFADYEAKRLEAEKLQQEIAEKAALRQSVLDRLGITEEEAKLLLG